MSLRNRIIAGGAVALLAVTLGGVSLALADDPAGNQEMTGQMTYYNAGGYGACGDVVDAATEDLVAVSHEWWTTDDPNEDPICDGVSVEVSYGGKSITVPVRDQCPSCAADHLDLSQTAFEQLAPLEKGLVQGITWKFVTDDGREITRPSSATSSSPASPRGTPARDGFGLPVAVRGAVRGDVGVAVGVGGGACRGAAVRDVGVRAGRWGV